MLNFLNANKKEILLKDGEEEKVFLAQAIPDMAFKSADRESLHAAVDMAVQRLSAKEQDVIRSVYLAEQTAAETADAMGVSQAYVYRLEKRGIRRLRGMLSKLIHERK